MPGIWFALVVLLGLHPFNLLAQPYFTYVDGSLGFADVDFYNAGTCQMYLAGGVWLDPGEYIRWQSSFYVYDCFTVNVPIVGSVIAQGSKILVINVYPRGCPPPTPPMGGGNGDGGDGGCGGSPPPPCSQSSCSSCSGMPVWSVSQPYTSLWLHDEPLGYQPSTGPRISFKLSFKQRELYAGYFPNIFSVGRKWNFTWLSYVTQDENGSNVVFFPGGGQRTLNAGIDYVTNVRLTGDTNSAFTLSYPDGSKDVYGFVVTNSAGIFQNAFLTERWNAQSQKTSLSYFDYDPTNDVVRLQYVVDGDGRTNFIYYATNSAYSTNLISQVVDPYGRTTSLAYDDYGHLTNIIDVEGISSSFTYDENDLVTSLTTPYGTTGFNIVDPADTSSGRSVLVIQPDGGHQLYLYEDSPPGFLNSYPAGQIPNTSPFANTLDTDLNHHDSFYWGPRQYAALSTTNISAFTANDFLKAQMRHWLMSSPGSVSRTLSVERDPSPDSAGTIEGQKTWYDYAGKTNSAYEGTQIMPLLVARVLPDRTTSFTRTDCNSFGAVTNEVSTYSASGGVALRTNIYTYDDNGIDLITTTNALGVQVSSNAYNANHEVVTSHDALGEETAYTYDSSNRLTGTTLPSGLATTNIYGADGFLAQQIVIGFATNSYTYINALVYTHTDARGLMTTNTWDNLNRLTSTIYPDGSYVSNQYTALDLTGAKDRLGNWTFYCYDVMRRKIAETNALSNVTLYNYCTCGALDSIVDAASNTTSFYYDNQGNLTNTLYADGYSVSRNFNLLKQVVSTSDSSGNSVTNIYNNQGLVVAVSNAFGRLQSTAYDVLDRATNTVDANGVSINTTYDNLSRPITRSYPDSGMEKFGYTLNVVGLTSYTNQIGNTVHYGYDAMNRKTSEVYVDVTTNSFAYDGAGDLLTLTDGKNQTTTWIYDSFGRVTNKVDAANNLIFVYQYDPNNRLTNRWTPAKGNTGYSYDALDNLTNVTYLVNPAISMAYDVLNRLTNMVDAVGTTHYSYDQVGQLLSEGGLWPNDIVSYSYQNRLRTGLTLSQPNASAWTQSYGYDSARRLRSVTSPAGEFDYTLGGASAASPLIKKLLLPNGAYITNTYDNVARLLSTVLGNSGNTVLDSEIYLYNLAAQRTAETNAAGDYRNYTYDSIGELKTAVGKEGGGTANRLQEQFGYAYDAAGNLNYRTNNALIQNFNVNELNELSTITRSGTLTVAGMTTSQATNVTVNLLTAALYGDYAFAKDGFMLADGSNTFTAIVKDHYGRMDTNSVTVNLPATNSYSYDLNGNLLSDGNRAFAYDDENQLIRATVTNAWKTEFTYDGKLRRRISKDYTWNGSSWLQTNEIRYVYDGNLVVQERNTNNLPQVTYTRGNDLSGTLQGTGGIGGLLARTANSSTSFYHSDGNGNIIMLISSSQMIVAKYLYDSFGNMLAMSGSLADANVYRFSSKEWNPNAGLYYYLYRFYDPNLQRWPNRDPIEEKGGLDLFEFVGNNSISGIDPHGTAVNRQNPFFQVSLFNGHYDTQASIVFYDDKNEQGCPNCSTIKLAQIVYSIYEDLLDHSIVHREKWRLDTDSAHSPWYQHQESSGDGVVRMNDDPGASVVNLGSQLYGVTQMFETCAVCLDGGPHVIGCVSWGQQVGGLRSSSSWGEGEHINPVSPSADFTRLTGFH